MTRMSSVVNRVLFTAAFVLAGLAILEKLTNLLGYTFLGSNYEPSRLIELAVSALLFVIALLLREIRDALTKTT